MRILTITAATLLAATALPAAAATSIVIQPLASTDPSAVPACTGTAGGLVDRLCNNTNFIGRDFGTTTSLASLFSVETDGAWLRFGTLAGSGELVNSNDVTTFLTLTPDAGFEVRMVGFTERRRTATGGLIPTYDLVDLGSGDVIWNRATGSFSGSRDVVVNSSWASDGLRFSWSNEGSGSLGVRALAFELRAVGSGEPPVTAIPEPASWAMLLAGFGMTGLIARRRGRSVAA